MFIHKNSRNRSLGAEGKAYITDYKVLTYNRTNRIQTVGFMSKQCLIDSFIRFHETKQQNSVGLLKGSHRKVGN